MTWQCPYSPLELAALNPHGFDYDDRVVLPDGRNGTVHKCGYKYCTVALDDGGEWKGRFTDLRPPTKHHAGKPRIEQLNLLEM